MFLATRADRRLFLYGPLVLTFTMHICTRTARRSHRQKLCKAFFEASPPDYVLALFGRAKANTFAHMCLPVLIAHAPTVAARARGAQFAHPAATLLRLTHRSMRCVQVDS